MLGIRHWYGMNLVVIYITKEFHEQFQFNDDLNSIFVITYVGISFLPAGCWLSESKLKC